MPFCKKLRKQRCYACRRISGSPGLSLPEANGTDFFDFCIQDQDTCGIVNGELLSKAFDKGTAVKRLCGYLKISKEDTIAFGDSMNDLEMLQAAGIGVCMANGSPSLLKIADIVCPPVDEDGLYSAFEKLELL